MSAAELAEVLSQVRTGDTDAWGELYRGYAPAIFRFCRRALPTREDAEDATTEIFMKVRQKLGTYDASRPFTAWLYKVASNHCWDLLRRRRVRQNLETGEVETLPLEHPDPDQLERLQTEHTSKEVRNGLAKLPDRARMALRHVLGCDVLTAAIPGLMTVEHVKNAVASVKERRQLDMAESRRHQELTADMWRNLPPDYHWLRDWQWV